jgi:Holliday junction resolvase RusA-like endonuclease
VSHSFRPTGPAYSFKVDHRPSAGSAKGKAVYQAAIAEAARAAIQFPIESDDVEVDLFYSSRVGVIVDLDNVVKPTLDALCGIAYVDDRQVRAVQAVRFDRTKALRVEGSAEQIEALILGKSDHVVWVNIYSDERLKAISSNTFGARWKRSLGYSTRRVVTKGEPGPP